MGICGGYQLFGHRYVDLAGRPMEGLGLLDVETVAGQDRLVGRVVAQAELWGRTMELVGFENHGGRTTLGPGCDPLAVVSVGSGNNGSDKTEGAAQGSIVGTYLHGPVLPSNPALADSLLERALLPITGGQPLRGLDDALEEAAHQRARDLANG